MPAKAMQPSEEQLDPAYAAARAEVRRSNRTGLSHHPACLLPRSVNGGKPPPNHTPPSQPLASGAQLPSGGRCRKGVALVS